MGLTAGGLASRMLQPSVFPPAILAVMLAVSALELTAASNLGKAKVVPPREYAKIPAVNSCSHVWRSSLSHLRYLVMCLTAATTVALRSTAVGFAAGIAGHLIRRYAAGADEDDEDEDEDENGAGGEGAEVEMAEGGEERVP